MSKTVRPLNDRVLVQRLEAEHKTAGGIFIPDNAKEKPLEGRVVAVGQGRLLETGERLTPLVKTGNKVLFGKWSGNEVKLDGQEYLLIKEDEIFAVLGS